MQISNNIENYDQRTPTTFVTQYNQDFSTGKSTWETGIKPSFQAQWDNPFTAFDENNLLNPEEQAGVPASLTFIHDGDGWSEQRVLKSKTTYTTPYKVSLQALINGPEAGIILRGTDDDDEGYQDTGKDTNGNVINGRNGIGIGPKMDGSGIEITIAGDANLGELANTPVEKIEVDKPTDFVGDLKGNIVWVFEDYGNTIYIGAGDKQIARIDLSNLVNGKYTQADIYKPTQGDYNTSGSQILVGTIDTNISVVATGKIGLAQRVRNIRIVNMQISNVTSTLDLNDKLMPTQKVTVFKSNETKLTVGGNSEFETYKIRNLLGKVVKSGVLYDNQIDVESFSRGVYIITLYSSSNGKTISMKFVF